MPVIWLIEDNAAFRKATQLALATPPANYLSRAFDSCESALAELKMGENPDVILLDVGLPGMDGIEGITHFKKALPDVNILILTVFEDNDKIFRAICAGASGYLLKSQSLHNLASAIEEAISGGSPMNTHIARRVLSMFSKMAPVRKDYGLTDREKDVLELMVGGLARKQIADKLDLNLHTLNYVVRCTYRKLHVNCQTAAVSIAMRDGLIDPEY